MIHFDIINNRAYLRLFSNSAAMLIMGVVLLVLFNQKHRQYSDSPAVKWEYLPAQVINSKPEIPKDYIPPPKPAASNNTAIQNNNIPQKIVNPTNPSNPSNFGAGINLPSAIGANSKTNSANSNGILPKARPSLPKLSAQTQDTILSTECLTKIDKDDRPKGCPPNNVARKLIEAARAPKYRPELVEGMTRAEYNARYYAGVRGKCQKDDGSQSQFCIPIGKKPARVKTPYELCVEMGMGGCTRPPRADGSKDESFDYGN